jgi:hypothetical protein
VSWENEASPTDISESFAVPSSLEDRRLAVVSALRAVAAEPAAVDPVHARFDELSGRLDEVLARLGSVETALLEAVWDRAAPAPDEAHEEVDAPVSVPAVDLGEGRMSSAAAKALFGH